MLLHHASRQQRWIQSSLGNRQITGCVPKIKAEVVDRATRAYDALRRASCLRECVAIVTVCEEDDAS